MKYSATVVLLATGAYAVSTITTPPSTETAAALSPQQSSMSSCVNQCGDNVTCKASCGVVPAPNSANAQANVDCVSKSCIPLQTVTDGHYSAYASCVASCAAEYYYNSQNSGGVPNVLNGAPAQATGSSSSGSGSSGSSGSNGSGSGSGSNGGSGSSGSGAKGSSTATGASASPSGKNAGNKVTYSAAGLLGVIGLLVLAL